MTDDEYNALKLAYERLQEDYETLEQRDKDQISKQDERNMQYQEGWKQCERSCTILGQRITEREQYIEELEVRLAEYIQYNKQYESLLEEKQQNIEQLQNRIEELEQWTGHLQLLCDERLERIQQLEHYIHHPISSMIKLIQAWIGKKGKENDRG